jgi:hypothetical protein
MKCSFTSVGSRFTVICHEALEIMMERRGVFVCVLRKDEKIRYKIYFTDSAIKSLTG